MLGRGKGWRYRESAGWRTREMRVRQEARPDPSVHKRTGTLWEGRYRATVVDSESYLLKLMHYIDMNPVRASMVSHRAHMRGRAFAGMQMVMQD
jgi:REP element-mobilizing transposase RayT